MSRLAWRFLLRELRAGELRLLALALVVAVAAVTAVGFFADRVRQALEGEARQLLGADLVLVSDHPWPASHADAAAGQGLRTARTEVFPSMILAGGQAQLADIKAVTAAYPLRGNLRLAPAAGAPDAPVTGAPPAGEAWLEERLVTALGLQVGATVAVGQATFRVAAILTQEPDRGVNFFSVAPRLLMNLDDLPATGLVQVGSRVSYRLLVAGEGTAVETYRRWLEPRLGRGERIEDIRNARPEIRSALDRAQRFLGLAVLLTVVLSAVAVALAARRYMHRHLDACAVMRCLGASQGDLLRLHGALFVFLAALSALAGCGLGYAAHFALHRWLAGLIAAPLPPPSLLPAAQGCVVAAVLLFGFALPPVLRLRAVPTLRVLRRELGPPGGAFLGGFGLGALLIAGLILWTAGDPRLGTYAVAGFSGAAVAFVALARGAVALLGRVRGGAGFGWRQGLATLERHAWTSTLQIAALAVGVMALLLLTATRNELLAAWQKATPPDAPNRFVINIQPDQVQPVARLLEGAGVAAEILPMVRGRLVRIGGRPAGPADYPDDERAQRLVEREFNLSWRADAPPGNRTVAGRWFEPAEAGQGLASVEEGLARTLGIRVGDTLDFAIAGKEHRWRVVGLRKLDWDSMRVNFFVLTPPGAIDGSPASYITSFHLPAARQDVANALVARFPNLTVIDVAAILKQLRALMDQVAGAVEFIFLFTLAAGAIVLHAALAATLAERRGELAVLRALGARRGQLRQALLTELAAIGAIAGLIAGGGALLVGGVLAQQVFQLDIPVTVGLLPLASAGAAALAVAAGWAGMARLLRLPAVGLLRAYGG